MSITIIIDKRSPSYRAKTGLVVTPSVPSMSAEGRAQTKENDAQPHTHPTQSGTRVSQGLGGGVYASDGTGTLGRDKGTEIRGQHT